MNKSLLVLTVVGLMTAVVSSADEAEEAGSWDSGRAMASEGRSGFHKDWHGPHGPCAKLNLSEEQKTKMREEHFKFKEGQIDLRAQLEKARLKYRRIVENPASDFKTAKAASQEVSDTLSKLINAKRAFKTQIAFQVLKPEQRGPAMACEGHRHGHHGHKRPHRSDGENWG